MSQPTPYTPSTDFSQQESINASGRSTVNTSALDAELANIETTLDQTLANLTLLQRDDGRLKDLACEVHTLSPEVLNLIGGFNLRGPWQADTLYAVKDIVSNTEYTYYCRTAHTSGGEFSAQYWTQFGFSGGADAAQAAAAAQVSANNASASANASSASAATASEYKAASAASADSASSSASAASTKAGESAASATNSSNSAAAAETAAANLPNATAAGANRFLKTTPDGLGWEYLTVVQIRAALGLATDQNEFYKSDFNSPAFLKTGAGTISIKAGVSVKVAGAALLFAVDTAVTMPALTGGTDYAIYVCADGSLRADPNWSAPTGYTTANSRKIGGFHYGLVAAGTTVAGGSFNAAGSPTTSGMIWTQGDVDKLAGIDAWSIWDLKYRPSCPDPRGFSRIGNMGWLANYICSTDPDVNGISKAGTNIASGTVLPKVPLAMGGNGVLTYAGLDWWAANEIVRAFGCRLPTAAEFYIAAFGVTENQSIDATASTYPVTQRNPGYTSRYGIEQAAGVHWIWGQDSAGSAGAWVANGGRGQSYNNSVVRVVLGGTRAFGSSSGSRCSGWHNVSSISVWSIGLRAASDHLQLA